MKVYCVMGYLNYIDDRDFGEDLIAIFANKEDAINFCIDRVDEYYSELVKTVDGEYVYYEPSELTVTKDYITGKFYCECPHEEYVVRIEEHEVK